MPDLITLGETMVFFAPLSEGPLRYLYQFEKHLGGAESNVAIAFARLGGSAGWVSKLGDDEFGRYVLNFIRGEGVDTRHVSLDSKHPTGIFFKQRMPDGAVQVFYYRRGSAASGLSPEYLDSTYFQGAKVFHFSGITPALSESCFQTVLHAIEMARTYGLEVSFDPNIRLKLWDAQTARAVLLQLISRSDIISPSLEECQILFGTKDEKKAAAAILSAGAKTALIKLGPKGAYLRTSQGNEFYTPPFNVHKVVDPVGAGDGFIAGFLYARTVGWSLQDAVRLAVTVGALAVTVPGDVEGYPEMDKVSSLWRDAGVVER